MPASTYRCHVICSTHWDREWVHTELENRFFLIECFDELIELFRKDPEAKYFHLDAQSIPVEDYIEARPEARETIKKFVSEGRLLIGPWYTLPEMNVTDGECTIRNLLQGHRLGKEYGHVMKVGYTPTGWGQLSQLPQIYAGFGIETALFYRGINQELTPAEYLWEAPDGTRVVGIRPSSVYSRANLWSWVYLPVVHNREYWNPSQVPYWPENGQTYRWSKPGETLSFELNPPERYNPENIPELMEKLIEGYREITTTNIIPAFQGHDQSRPNPEVPRLIADINERCPDVEMIYSNFEIYADEVVQAVKSRDENLVVSGEMRHTNISAPWNMCHLLPGITSCRARLKVENRKNEIALLRLAEPVAALQYLLGHQTPGGMLELAWKKLLTNHSHDSIGGCCLDRVIQDVLFRGQESRFISEGIVRHGLPQILRHIQSGDVPRDAILLTAFNLRPTARDQVVTVEVDIPLEMDRGSFCVIDSSGRAIQSQILNREEKNCSVAKWGFDYGFKAQRYTAAIRFLEVPALGYTTCLVKPCEPKEADSIASSPNHLENEFLKLEVQPTGTITLTDKKTGEVYQGLNRFEDRGEIGNAWIPLAPDADRIIHSDSTTAELRLLVNGPVTATVEIRNRIEIPVSATSDFKARSEDLGILEIVSEVTLTQGAQRVDITCRIDNPFRDHRLQVLFPSGVKTDQYQAAVPFDVVTRPIPKPSQPDWVEPVQQTDPNTGFASIAAMGRGLSILNQGIYEVEVKDDPERSIALTLLRCSWQHGLWDTNRWPDDGFQNLGQHEFAYSIVPHAGTWSEAEIHRHLYDFETPLLVAQTGRNPNGHLPPRASMIEISNPMALLSGIKHSEDGQGLVLRVFNPSAETVETDLRTFLPIRQARLLDMEEKGLEDLPISDGATHLSVAHHKILTIKIVT
ncbi:MAG: alpha-mannosidase [Puniceicoccaceae bacterium]